MTGVLKHTQRIIFELSNRCNYATMHPKCPASLVTRPRTLSSVIVQSIVNVMADEGFAGTVSFHNYNEPLIDPRLFSLIGIVRLMCPSSNIFIMTNGWNLDQTMLHELEVSGVSRLEVNAYSRWEYGRLQALDAGEIGMKVTRKRPAGLDGRLENYDKKVVVDPTPCVAPLGEVIIRHTGEVGLCCNDWDMKHVFGNLEREFLGDILAKPEVTELHDSLMKGKRILEICKRCTGGRGCQ